MFNAFETTLSIVQAVASDNAEATIGILDGLSESELQEIVLSLALSYSNRVFKQQEAENYLDTVTVLADTLLGTNHSTTQALVTIGAAIGTILE